MQACLFNDKSDKQINTQKDKYVLKNFFLRKFSTQKQIKSFFGKQRKDSEELILVDDCILYHKEK